MNIIEVPDVFKVFEQKKNEITFILEFSTFDTTT